MSDGRAPAVAARTSVGGGGKASAARPALAAKPSFIRAPTMSAWQKTAARGRSADASAHAARSSSALVPYLTRATPRVDLAEQR
jgi:hypothetical protein